MAIIVDANTTHLLFNGDLDGGFVFQKIVSGEIKYLTGGKHKSEILIAGMPKSLLRQLILAGRIYVYDDDECLSYERNIVSKLPLKSDDPHIIALAIKSGCRLLYSFDSNLCDDFKNKKIIDSPRGKIYQSKKHANLLKTAPSAK